MPKVRLNYEISGFCQCTVDVPQAVIDEYNRLCDAEPGDGRAIDNLLEPYVNYDDMVNQLDEAEDIELTELKPEVAALAK